MERGKFEACGFTGVQHSNMYVNAKLTDVKLEMDRTRKNGTRALDDDHSKCNLRVENSRRGHTGIK